MRRLEQWIYLNTLKPSHTELEKEKLKFGIHLMIQELYKLLLVYFIAILMNVVVEVFIVHGTFFFIRQVALGYHFSSKIECILWSILLFPVLCKLVLFMDFNYNLISNTSIFIIIIILLAIIGPVGTAKTPITWKHSEYLRKNLYIRLIILSVIFLFSPINIQFLLVIGLLIQLIMIILQLIKNKRGN